MILLKRSPFMGGLILLLMCFSKQSKAVVGVEFTYQYLSSNQYAISLWVYRLCSDPLPSNSQTINYNSTNCGIGNTMTLPLDTFYEISGIENTFYAQSSCNGGTHLGMQVFLYQDTLTFPQSCTDWVLDWTGCCRSSSITNLSATGSPIYVEAGINSFGNYSLSSYIVSDYYCAGDSMRTKRFYRNFMSDTDSSLVRLTCPKQGANNCISYVAGLSAAQPFFTHANNPVQLNSNGVLDFRTQPGLSQIASIGMTVYEINNNDTVGYSMHDIPIVILDSLCNQPVEVLSITPLLGGYDTLNNLIHFCSNNANGLNVILFDPDGDTIQLDPSRTNINQIFGPSAALFLNTNPPFRPDSAQMSIQIILPYASNEDYCRNPATIGIMSQGGNSPLVSTTVWELSCETYAIIANASQTVVCPNISHQIQLTSEISQPTSVPESGWYQWTQVSGPPVWFSNDTISNPVLTVPAHSSTSTPIVLEVQHLSGIDTITGSACTSSSSVILFYDTTNTCNTPYPKAVEGFVLDDVNQNCIADSLEEGHRHAKILAFDNGLDTFYCATDHSGYYAAYLDTGTYTIHLLNNNPVWTACPATQTVFVDTNYVVQQADFVMEAKEFCPQLELSVKPTSFFINCQRQNVSVSYKNTGTVDAENAYVDVTLDNMMGLLSSELPIASQTNNTFRFNLDTITYGETGQFNILVRPNCQQFLGQYFFVEGHIYPDTLCDSLSRYIDLQESCSMDTTRFVITNYSNTPVLNIPYWIVEDNIVIDTGTVQLLQGQTRTIQQAQNPSSPFPKFHQIVLYPYSSEYMASLPVSCRAAPHAYGYRNPFFMPHYRRNSISTYYSISGLPYDPNTKVANPVGYDSLNHYIFPNHPIDYTVHFQNTGTDTAEVVVILDTLSSHFDIGSLDMGGSSHPYTWRILPYTPTGLHVLEITFDQIMLPDSNINEAASHGFVEYHIEQIRDLPNFTRLENSASIYFDANAPIKTNTTFHTVCDSCFSMNIMNNTVVVGNEERKDAFPEVRLYPNPADPVLMLESTQKIEDVFIYNTLGQKVYQQLNVANERVSISTHSLENGTYFVSLLINGKLFNRAFQVLH